jgi:hypothetical protein
MSFSTRHLSILSLLISVVAMVFAAADFSGLRRDSSANPAAIILPAQSLAQTLDNTGTTDFEKALAYWLTREAPGVNYYTHPTTGLTFPYHKDFQLMAGEDEGGEIIVVENAEHGLAFQIFIQPFDEPGPLTPERIRRDLPNLKMETITEIEFYRTGEPVLTFLSVDDTLGYIPEAWFIYNGYLYQLAMYAPGDPEQLLYPWFNGFLQSLSFTATL